LHLVSGQGKVCAFERQTCFYAYFFESCVESAFLQHPIVIKKKQKHMETRISIPKPCHEDWNKMLPEEQGRHCLSCQKNVVDFSGWETEQIHAYLQNRNGERVCGRFNASQVSTSPAPEQSGLMAEVLRARAPFLRKVAALIVICFGLLGAEDAHAQKIVGKIARPQPVVTEKEYITGDVAVVQPDTLKPVAIDTLQPEPLIMGMIKMPDTPPKEKVIPKKSKAKRDKAAGKANKTK
jgi:hypothetical protein